MDSTATALASFRERARLSLQGDRDGKYRRRRLSPQLSGTSNLVRASTATRGYTSTKNALTSGKRSRSLGRSRSRERRAPPPSCSTTGADLPPIAPRESSTSLDTRTGSWPSTSSTHVGPMGSSPAWQRQQQHGADIKRKFGLETAGMMIFVI